MAGKNEVTLTFAGDSEKLERSFDKVGAAAHGMSSEVGASARGFDLANEAADGAENKFQGVASTLEGTRDSASGLAMIAKGDLFNGLVMTGQGAADLAEGMAYTVIPTIKFLATQAGHTAVAMVRSAGRQAAAWAMMSARALMHAARIAAAWIISMGPIAIVAAAVVGLTVLVVKNWSRIRNFITSAASAVLGFLRRNWPLILGILTGPIGLAVVAIARHRDRIVGLFRAIPGALRGIFSGLAGLITGPIQAAIQGIRNAWNSTLGGKGFSAPSWVPGIGGKGFHIPYLHSGGVVPGPRGANVLTMLQAGETVTPAGAGGRVVLELRSGGTRLDDALVEILARAIGNRGGNVQLVLGRG